MSAPVFSSDRLLRQRARCGRDPLEAIQPGCNRMLIINADDWGRSVAETDAALRCYKEGRITSVSAMVFMEDSERAAELAKENELDVGLHLNFTDRFTDESVPREPWKHHEKIDPLSPGNKYAQLLYNPFSAKRICLLIRSTGLRSSRVCLANRRHTSTDIITCIFAPIFFSAI